MHPAHNEPDMVQTLGDHAGPDSVGVATDLFMAQPLPQSGQNHACVVKPDQVEMGLEIHCYRFSFLEKVCGQLGQVEVDVGLHGWEEGGLKGSGQGIRHILPKKRGERY